jgi:hypothetical protein
LPAYSTGKFEVLSFREQELATYLADTRRVQRTRRRRRRSRRTAGFIPVNIKY